MRRSTYGATELWRTALRAEWDERRGLDIERNRIEAGNGAMVDIGNEPAVNSFARNCHTVAGDGV